MVNYGNFRHPNFIVLPDLVTAVGEYLTRCGDTVVVDTLEPGPLTGQPGARAYGVKGYYKKCGTRDCWDMSGRISSYRPTPNDIVSPRIVWDGDAPDGYEYEDFTFQITDIVSKV